MGLDESQERRIDAPPERVAAFAFDPANDTAAWIGGIKSVRVLTDGPLGIGTRAIPVPPTGSEGG